MFENIFFPSFDIHFEKVDVIEIGIFHDVFDGDAIDFLSGGFGVVVSFGNCVSPMASETVLDGSFFVGSPDSGFDENDIGVRSQIFFKEFEIFLLGFD